MDSRLTRPGVHQTIAWLEGLTPCEVSYRKDSATLIYRLSLKTVMLVVPSVKAAISNLESGLSYGAKSRRRTICNRVHGLGDRCSRSKD